MGLYWRGPSTEIPYDSKPQHDRDEAKDDACGPESVCDECCVEAGQYDWLSVSQATWQTYLLTFTGVLTDLWRRMVHFHELLLRGGKTLTEKGRPQERLPSEISLVSCAMGAGNRSIGQVCYYLDFRLAIGPWVVRVLSTIVATG